MLNNKPDEICDLCASFVKAGSERCPVCDAVRKSRMTFPGRFYFWLIVLFWFPGHQFLKGYFQQYHPSIRLYEIPEMVFNIGCPLLLLVVLFTAKRIVRWRRWQDIYDKNVRVNRIIKPIGYLGLEFRHGYFSIPYAIAAGAMLLVSHLIIRKVYPELPEEIDASPAKDMNAKPKYFMRKPFHLNKAKDDTRM